MDNDIDHTCVIIAPRESDFIAGVNSPLPYVVNLPTGDWESYLPAFDLQKDNGLETDACVTFTAVQSVATQINRFMAANQLPQHHIDALKRLGFIDRDGTFHASERFIAKLDGTTLNGNTLAAPWDAMRTYGLIPYSDWAFDATIQTWEEYYADIPQPLLDKGKEFLDLFGFAYEFVTNPWPAGSPVSLIKHHLQQAPLAIAAPVCWPWNQLEPPVCGLTNPAHSTMIYSEDALTHILDHYVPFKKELDPTYNIPYVMKGIVSIVPAPVVTTPPVIAPTKANVAILTQIAALYRKILSLIKGQNQ